MPSDRALACPNVKNHTKRPESYTAFLDWAEKKDKTHDQTRCPECKLWAIWVKRPPAVPVSPGEATDAETT